MTDKQAVDEIFNMLDIPEWSGAEMLEWIAEVVAATGRTFNEAEIWEKI